MTVLVTGGAGMIGSNVVRRLVSKNVETIVADNLWRGKLENLCSNEQQIIDLDRKLLQYDLSDYENCLAATTNIDTVIHLADIVAGINYVFSNQLFLFRKNILINSNVLNAAIENGVNKYLYVGTACSYPAEMQSYIDPPPFVETDAYPANPESAYGWSKLMGEYECELAQREGKINVSILRLHNVFGPHSELSPEKSQVIPALCRKAIRYPKEEFIVWGTGSQRRAFLYVDDAVDAILTALHSGMNKGVIQIGPTKSESIASVAEKIVSLSGRDIPIQYDLSKPEGDKDRTADISKALELLGWFPKISIDEGLMHTFRWAREYLETTV